MTDEEFCEELAKADVHWPIDYGSVKVQIRNGRPTLITIEKTVKMD